MMLSVITSGTIFASRKLPLRDYVLASALFVNGAKGMPALQLSRAPDCQYKTAFVLTHKLREAMAADQADARVSGTAGVDGAYFGGYVKPGNRKENRKDLRLIVASKCSRSAVAAASWSRRSRTCRLSRHAWPASRLQCSGVPCPQSSG